jgi:hypothetical protein
MAASVSISKKSLLPLSNNGGVEARRAILPATRLASGNCEPKRILTKGIENLHTQHIVYASVHNLSAFLVQGIQLAAQLLRVIRI